jgi:hypothetical protein
MSGVTTQTGGRKERFLNKEGAKISKKGSAFLPSPPILQTLQPPDRVLDSLSLLCDLCGLLFKIRLCDLLRNLFP